MEALRKIRKKRGLTLKALAKEVNMSNVSLSRLERGLANPNKSTRHRIEQYFGEPINWLDIPPINVTPRKNGSTWTEAERTFRQLLKLIAGLPQEQREEFLTLMKRHMRQIK